MSLRASALLLLLLPAVLFAGGCGTVPPGTADQGCTVIGCGSAFSVNFLHAGAWPAGSYAVEVEVDGATFTCSATLPLQCNAPSPCPAGSPFLLGRSGCALDAAQQSLSGIDFDLGSAPASVRVKVSWDGATLGIGTFSPTFTTSRPNGASCEPVCKSAPPATLAVQ